MAEAYRKEQNIIKSEKAESIARTLPYFCQDYYRHIGRKSANTKLVYMQRLDKFFDYLNLTLKLSSKRDVTLEILDQLTVEDMDEFIMHIAGGEDQTRTASNYLSALNSFFIYLEKTEKVKGNPAALVDRSGFKKTKNVTRLNDAQEEDFIDSALNGVGLTKKELSWHKKTLGTRDYAICLTLVRTGLRVSELVGLDIDDIDFKENAFHIIRKRNKVDVVFFDDEVAESLKEYLGDRYSPQAKGPVFIVPKGKYAGERLNVRSVQRIVKKYAVLGAPGIGSKITPHKLRATYATNMLKETGNIELVKEELGHENIQTTSIYIDDATLDKKNARNILMERRERLNRTGYEDDEAGTIYKKED